MTEDSNWRRLDALGKRYRELVDEGYGVPLETRTDEQVEIANTIVEETYPLLNVLAMRALGYRNAKKRFEKAPSIRAHYATTTVEDLAQEGALVLMKRLHTYKPEYALSTFIIWQFNHVVRSPELGLTHVPTGVITGTYLPATHQNPAIERARKGHLDYALRGDYDALPTAATEKKLEEWSDDAQEYLRDYGHEDTTRIDRIDDRRMTKSILAHSEDKKHVLKRRFGPEEATLQQIANDHNLSIERIRQIEHKELKLARKHAKKIAPTPPVLVQYTPLTPEMIEDVKDWLWLRNMTKSRRNQQPSDTTRPRWGN